MTACEIKLLVDSSSFSSFRVDLSFRFFLFSPLRLVFLFLLLLPLLLLILLLLPPLPFRLFPKALALPSLDCSLMLRIRIAPGRSLFEEDSRPISPGD